MNALQMVAQHNRDLKEALITCLPDSVEVEITTNTVAEDDYEYHDVQVEITRQDKCRYLDSAWELPTAEELLAFSEMPPRKAVYDLTMIYINIYEEAVNKKGAEYFFTNDDTIIQRAYDEYEEKESEFDYEYV